MGSGVAKQSPSAPTKIIVQPTGSGSTKRDDREEDMECYLCHSNFHIFKRKFLCKDCKHKFCSNCITKEPGKQSKDNMKCKRCNVFSKDILREVDLKNLAVKDLRYYLDLHNISMQTCTEKKDLIDLILRHHSVGEISSQESQPRTFSEIRFQQQPDCIDQLQGQSQRSSSSQTQPQQQQQQQQQPGNVLSDQGPSQAQQTRETENEKRERLQRRQEAEMQESEARRPKTPPALPEDNRPRRMRASVTDLSSAVEIHQLNIRQLKEILAANFVDYKGCVERRELEERVQRLFHEKEELRRGEKANKEHNADTITSPTKATTEVKKEEGNLCKICMDHIIDCVLLECGHMITCTQCGKRMNECPICRQYIVRVVHVFKS